MKKIIPFLFFLFPLLTNAQWQQLPGPEGGWVNCMERASFGILCGTYGGVYISSNEGASWTYMSSVGPLRILDLVTSNDTVVIFYNNYVMGNLTTGLFAMTSYD